MSEADNFKQACPIPTQDYPTVLLAHGGGGKLMNQLIEKMFIAVFDNPVLRKKTDAAQLNLKTGKIAFTTDSYVISPLFFPGGNIGSLAVHGTVNDLATSGARPLYLSTGFIIEEGLPMETLWRIINSLAETAEKAGVAIVTGDTKVVDRGKGDGIFINTCGIGLIEHDLVIEPGSIQPGDSIILSGDIGRHGMAIMAARESLGFESKIKSDSANLSIMILDLIESGVEIHCLRDLTRGGLAGGLNELATASDTSMEIDESKIPIQNEVNNFCEILGIDPLHVANEGCMVAFVAKPDTDQAIAIMQKHPDGRKACLIGQTSDDISAKVILKNRIGTRRILSMFSGEQLPRIC